MDFENNKRDTYKSIMLIVITAFITFLITAFAVYNFYIKDKNKDSINTNNETGETTANEFKFSSILEAKLELVKNTLEQYYLGEIPADSELIDSAISGYVKGLEDDYTEYLSKEEYKNLMVDVNGNFVGIGVYMSQTRYGDTIILMPIKNSPAEEAGLQTGDIIVKVNGEECNEVDTSIVSSKIKGEEGTTVELEILRGSETLTKTITRRKVEINYMESKVLEDNIGYIKIPAFDDECSEKFEEKLKEMQKQEIKSLVIDVRDNGGGIVTKVEEISELLMEKDKTVVITKDKNNNEEIYITKDNYKFEGNIVLLINENSASASEILAGALKDNKVATLIGKTTYGKGVMQDILPISDGSALKVTIREFLTPNKQKINNVGIEPDIDIDDDKNTEKDEQLEKAINFLKQ